MERHRHWPRRRIDGIPGEEPDRALAHDPQMEDAALEFLKRDPGRYGFALVVAAENQAAARERLVAALDGEEPVERLEQALVVHIDDVAVADLDDREGALADADGGGDGSPIAVVEPRRNAARRGVDQEAGGGAFRGGPALRAGRERGQWVMGGLREWRRQGPGASLWGLRPSPGSGPSLALSSLRRDHAAFGLFSPLALAMARPHSAAMA